MLTEIHRQAAESAVTVEMLLNGGQVICGLNATRFALNNAMRKAAGFNGAPLPTGPGEKIICLKNDHALGLLHGMFFELDAVEQIDDQRFQAIIKTEEGDFVGGENSNGKPRRLPIYAGHFLDHEKLDTQRDDRDWKIKRRLVEATFGWAITCHKAQGSSWLNVIVIDDKWGRPKADRNRWLYTALPRAEEGLVILD
jgi:exodeoxyribonuclease-5